MTGLKGADMANGDLPKTVTLDSVRGEISEEERRLYSLLEAADEFVASARQQLRRGRQEQGLSQECVAERMGTSQAVVSRIETGSGELGLTTLFRYAGALGAVPVVSLLSIEDLGSDVTDEANYQRLQEVGNRLLPGISAAIVKLAHEIAESETRVSA
jgi:transcriptional regulator with XRE-family HTH domain